MAYNLTYDDNDTAIISEDIRAGLDKMAGADLALYLLVEKIRDAIDNSPLAYSVMREEDHRALDHISSILDVDATADAKDTLIEFLDAINDEITST